MELKNRSFQYGKVALPVRTQYHQLQFVLKVVTICTDICMSLVQTVLSLLLTDFLSADPVAASICRRSRNKTGPCQEIPPTTFWHCNPYLLCLKTLISIPSYLVKTIAFTPNKRVIKCNQNYVIRNTFCSKYPDRYFPYWKIRFLSSIF